MSAQPTATFDAVVIGAGFAGMYMLYRLRKLGLTARVYEAGDGVGGTWYWNRYPGARCDNPSVHYSYSFSPELEQEWQWSEVYAAQPEILRYLNHVADRFDLRRDIQLSTPIRSAHYDQTANYWLITTEQGEQVAARFCITAVGCLSAPNVPALPGLDQFAGEVYHSGMWPHTGVDFSGKRVGLIGTGSTGMQATPVIAAQASQLYVFQRTPNYSLPAYNRPLPAEELAALKARYPELRAADRAAMGGQSFALPFAPTAILALTPEQREERLEQCWELGSFALLNAFTDLYTSLEANQYAADFVRRKIRALVADPQTAEKLLPHDHPLGSKRIPIHTDYFTSFNRANVTLVDLRSAPIETLTATGLQAGGVAYALDCLVLATGFDALTGALFKIDIRGRAGLALREKWAAGPRTYLGLQSVGFPNLFTITGPGSPSVLSNLAVSIEQHVEWIADCLAHMQAQGLDCIEPTPQAEEDWVAHVNEVASQTIYPLANSWYMGANIPGKPRIFMPYVGGVGVYRQKCAEVAAQAYVGFAFGAS